MASRNAGNTAAMSVTYHRMQPQDYAAADTLWTDAEGVGLSASDSEEAIRRYLERNPGLSFIARDGQDTVGAVLCGHDGRRGYLYHLAVAPSHRRRGIGRELARRALEGLRREGILKCHLMVLLDNVGGRGFWERTGWIRRDEIVVMSKYPAPEDRRASR